MIHLTRKHHFNVIAITDHDTTEGIPEAQQVAQGWPVVMAGIELSADDHGVDVHVLGYDLNIQDAVFQSTLTGFRDTRLRRGREIVQRLAELAMPIEWERVLELANGGAVGRPHIARTLVQAGYVSSVNEAFDLYLRSGGPADVARPKLSPEAAITLIHQAGGVAVLAHPGYLPDYAALIERLVPAGLDGVEIMHPANTSTVRQNLHGLAVRHNLIITGGSDFHRAGDTLGAETPPAQSVRALRERAEYYRSFGIQDEGTQP